MELIGVVETRENLEEFIRRCDTGMYKCTGIGKIKKVAKSRLKLVVKAKEGELAGVASETDSDNWHPGQGASKILLSHTATLAATVFARTNRLPGQRRKAI